MWNLLQRWLRPSQDTLPRDDERLLELEREAQSLRLELKEMERVVASLKSELERQRSGENARVSEAVRAQIERLLSDLSAPVVQLLTQAHLVEVDSKPVQAKDVLAVAKRLVRTLEDNGLTLEDNGLTLEHRVGETQSFDPNRHEPLKAGTSLKSGQPVVVRFVGVAYQGKMLRKAEVERARD